MTGICGFDTKEAAVILIGKVGEGGCFFLPRIPDYGGEAVRTGDVDTSLPFRIVEGGLVTGSIVDAVGFGSDGEFFLVLILGGFRSLGGVDEGGVLQASEGDVRNIGNGKVAVQGPSHSHGLRGKVFPEKGGL